MAQVRSQKFVVGEMQAFMQPEFFKRRVAKLRLEALPPAIKETVRDIAWFKHDDRKSGEQTPILLKSFRPLPLNASPKSDAARSAPVYFTSIKDAAVYAGKTERTILNWKQRNGNSVTATNPHWGRPRHAGLLFHRRSRIPLRGTLAQSSILTMMPCSGQCSSWLAKRIAANLRFL